MIDFGVTERKVAELEQRMKSCNLYEKDIEEKFVGCPWQSRALSNWWSTH